LALTGGPLLASGAVMLVTDGLGLVRDSTAAIILMD
jgi:hypothetical protein